MKNFSSLKFGYAVPTNSAEVVSLVHIAVGLASELEYHLLRARDWEILRNEAYDSFNSEVIEIKRMLTTFIAKLLEGSR